MEEVEVVHYLMAAIGVTAVIAMLWRALRPQRPAAPAVLAPDDDPEFLKGLNRKPGEER